MAQTGFTPIQLYSSSTATNVPLAANLATGELAINITDGKLFYKDNSAAVQVIGWKVVPATAGGTGQTSYAIGDLLYANTTTTLAKLADVATGNALISGGVGVAPSWGKIGLTTHISGVLPVANGGTNASTASITSFNNITGYSASGATGTTTTNLVFSTSPTLVTPNIGDATGTQLNIDNLRLDGNTISSQDTNGVINLLPNGTTGDVRATTRLRFQSNAQNSDGALASYRVSLSTVATDISAYDGTWGHLAIVTGLGGAGGDFFTDLVFSCVTAGPTVLSAKTVSGAPAARTYSMSGSNKLQLAMASGTYDVRSAILYGLQ
jgi:hypothetical protein